MSTLLLVILIGSVINLLQLHFNSFTKLNVPIRLLQFGQCSLPFVQDSCKRCILYRL